MRTVKTGHSTICSLLATLLLVVLPTAPTYAQMPGGGWSTDLDMRPVPSAPATPAAPATQPDPPTMSGQGTTVLKKKSKEQEAPAAELSKVRLVALLTADGQRIEQDLVWRVFDDSSTPGNTGKLLSTHNEASPLVKLKPGTYTINAAFGRAHLTRKITVAAGVETTEPFVLNAGGLRLRVTTSSDKMDASKAIYDILTDERDQRGNRKPVLSRAKPNVVMRLNSGIYRVVSTLGDANATVEADVTVEAGKLTEASLTHKAARVTLKLVTRQGGEALPDTEWTVLTETGQTVKSSVGALPTHIFAPGNYLAVAKSQGKVFRRNFTVSDGEVVQVEVMRQ